MVCRRGGLPDFWTLGPLVLWTICLAACAPNHLPDQDLRILTAQPSAKMPPGDLWKDFEKDVVAARAQYFGQAIDLSGRITSIEADTSKGRHIFFSQVGDRGIRARLLDDRAGETLKDLKGGDRVTLRCFCEGFDERKDLVLKSCIRP